MKKWLKQYAIKCLHMITQNINVILLDGHEDEFTSSRCWRLRDKPFWKQFRWLIDKVFGEGHCEAAYEVEKNPVPSWEK